MSTTATRAQQFREFAEQGDHQGFEDLWLERLDAAPAEVDSFIEGGDALASQGQFEKAGLYLSMLSPVLLERELYLEALQVLRKMAEVAPRERGLRHGLLTAYRGLYADDPNLETFLQMCGVADGKDLKAAVAQMGIFLCMKEGAYLYHPGGWHAGRISEVDADDASLVIDFDEKRGHRMSMEMAAKKTDLIAEDDLRAMKLDRLEEVKRLVEDDPVELIRCGLRSRRGKATLRDLRDRIAGDIIPTKSWSRWWQKARGKVKAAGDITITPGANPTLELGEETGGYAEACLRDLGHLPTDARRVRYFRDLMKEAPAHEDGIPALVGVTANLVAAAPEMSTADRISLSFLLAEAAQKWSEITSHEELSPAQTLRDHDAAVKALPSIPIAGHRVAAMLQIKQFEDVDWPALCHRVIIGGAAESADHCLSDLLREGHTQVAEDSVNTVADRYRDHPRAFTWYVRAARGDKLPAGVRRDRNPVLLEKSLVLHSHLDKEAIRLKDLKPTASDESKDLAATLAKVFPLKDYGFVRDSFTEANESEAMTLAALLRNNRSLNSDLRDRMMAHMFRTRPEAAKFDTDTSAAASDPMFDTSIIYTTERALQARRVEHEDVVNNQIPENSVEIGRAASYGDLSENAEWAAAVEKQSRLSKLAEELAEGLQKARIISGDVQDGTEGNVTLGSRVSLTDTQGRHHSYTVLGPWDVDAKRSFISYLSPLGRALVGHEKDETIGLDVAAGHVEYTITAIEDGLEDAERSAP